MPSWSASDFASRPPPDPPKKPDQPPAAPSPPPAPTTPPKKSAAVKSAPPKPAAIAVPAKPAAASSPAVATAAPPSQTPSDSNEIDLLPREERKQTAAPPNLRTDYPVNTCQMCGYAFKGKPQIHCPECSGNMQTGASDLLKFSSRPWLSTAAVAMHLTILAMAAHGTAAVLRFMPDTRIAAALIHPAASLLLMLAVFLATRDEKRPFLERSPSILIARIAVSLATLFWIVATLLFFKNMHASVEIFRHSTLPAYLAALMCDAATAAAFGYYTHQLAGRLPDDSLSVHTINSTTACTVGCAVFAACHFFGLANPAYFIAYFCAFPVMAAGIASLVYPMITLLRLSSGLRHAAKESDLVAARRRAAQYNSA